MKVELRLLSILQLYGLNTYGYQSRIAEATGIPRKIIGRMCKGQQTRFSLDQLTRVCRWLHEQHVPLPLPGALFGYAPSDLLSTLAAPGQVSFYLGEYRGYEKSRVVRSWVALSDSQLAAVLVELLSGMAPSIEDAPAAPVVPVAAGPSAVSPTASAGSVGTRTTSLGQQRFEYVYVPSSVTTADGGAPTPAVRGRLDAEAVRLFKAMRSTHAAHTSIIIGSQRANALVEHFVCDLFRCEPFGMYSGRVPFYIVKPDHGLHMPASAFGGTRPPMAGKELSESGLWYRSTSGGWQFAASRPGERDAGLAILRRDLTHRTTELALFGVSGAATVAMTEILRNQPDLLWKSSPKARGGVTSQAYLCEFTMAGDGDADDASHAPRVESYKVVELNLAARSKAA